MKASVQACICARAFERAFDPDAPTAREGGGGLASGLSAFLSSHPLGPLDASVSFDQRKCSFCRRLSCSQ